MKQNKVRRYGIVIGVLVLILLGFVVLNIRIGSVEIPLQEMGAILLKKESVNDNYYDIVWKIRLPRLLAALFLGGALALSGFLLQTFFHNPIAGPYVLGISSGAKLVVALVMVFSMEQAYKLSSGVMIGAAFVGSLISMGFVLLMARKVERMSMLIVSGVMIGYISSAITDFVVTFADDSNIVNLHNWSKGSFSGTSWSDVQVIVIFVVAVSLCVFLMAKPIGAYQLGEVYAQNMGVNIRRFRILLVLFSSLLSACVTAFAGPISFVGIAVPHLVKRFLNTSNPILVIPVSFLGGAIFCLGCDLIARTAFAPTDLSISSVTALFGAPVVLVIMVNKRK
ncbi:MAG: FecCD family ABC transporter permease [Lachnospiraceae bacterium]